MHAVTLFFVSCLFLCPSGASDHNTRDIPLACQAEADLQPPPGCVFSAFFNMSVDNGQPRPFGDPLNVQVYDKNCTPIAAAYKAGDNKCGITENCPLGAIELATGDDIEIIGYMRKQGGRPVYNYTKVEYANKADCKAFGGADNSTQWVCVFPC